MIYIGTTRDSSSAIYFDIHATERRGRIVCISGTIGDGCYEGEALVELGRTDEITYADAWLGGDGFQDFISRCDLDLLENTLIETLREMPTRYAQRRRPHRLSRIIHSPAVAESQTGWNRVC